MYQPLVPKLCLFRLLSDNQTVMIFSTSVLLSIILTLLYVFLTLNGGLEKMGIFVR